MRFTSILATLFIIFLISLAIFQRDVLFSLFAGTPEERAERVLIDEFNEKSKEILQIENEIRASEEAIKSSQKALESAQEDLKAIEDKMQNGGNDVEAARDAFEKSQGPQPIAVVARRSMAASMQDGVMLAGNVESAKKVDVRAETSGTVASAPISKGQTVSVGDVLCQLDDGARSANVAQAKAAYDAAFVQVETARKLAQNGLTSRAATRSAEAQLAQAEAALAQAQEEMKRTTVTAPMAGVIETTPLESGDFLQAGGVCATIIDPNALKLVGNLTEAQLENVVVGAAGGARLKNGENLLGRVSSIAETADPVTLTYRVEIEVPNSGGRVRAGASADIFITVEGTEGHLLPQNAITLSDDGEVGVRIVEKDGEKLIAAFHPVKVLRTDDRGMWVGGLPQSTDIIIVGQEYASNGREVLVTYETEQQSATASDADTTTEASQ